MFGFAMGWLLLDRFLNGFWLIVSRKNSERWIKIFW